MLIASMWQAPSVLSSTLGMPSVAILRVIRCRDVSFDHRDPPLCSQPLDQCSDQARFTSSRRSHDIDQQRVVRLNVCFTCADTSSFQSMI